MANHPDANLRVYSIWTERLVGDSREGWDAAGLTDPRVTHLWDPDNAAGPWLAGNLDGYEGGDWDFYMLFGPDSTWSDAPGPLLDSGFTVIGRSEQLRQSITTLLEDTQENQAARSTPLPMWKLETP